MDKKQFKRGAAVAASAAALVGLVFATPTIAEAKSKSHSSSSSSSTTKSVETKKLKGDGDHHKDGKKGDRPAPISQVVTVNVPDDGKTYKLVVTEVKPVDLNTTDTKPARPAHTFVVAVTGTGSVDVTVPGLHPGSYTVDLVAVSSTQTITVVAPAVTPAPVTPTPAPTPAP